MLKCFQWSNGSGRFIKYFRAGRACSRLMLNRKFVELELSILSILWTPQSQIALGNFVTSYIPIYWTYPFISTQQWTLYFPIKLIAGHSNQVGSIFVTSSGPNTSNYTHVFLNAQSWLGEYYQLFLFPNLQK